MTEHGCASATCGKPMEFIVPNYSQLSTILKSLSAPLSEFDVSQYSAPCLIHAWVTDYGRSTPDYDIIETSNDAGFSYLFDIQTSTSYCRLRSCSTKKDTSSRDIIERRMRGHPLKNLVCGKRYNQRTRNSTHYGRAGGHQSRSPTRRDQLRSI